MKELSRQPSADFGSRVSQMQKRFLVLIFKECASCRVNELAALQFTGTWPFDFFFPTDG